MSFSDRLKMARKKVGLTQAEISKKLGTTSQNYSQYETGNRNPKPDTIAKISKILNLGYGYTKNGEPYFYSFVDTTDSENENIKFNKKQYNDAIGESSDNNHHITEIDNIVEKEIYLDHSTEMLKKELIQNFDLVNSDGKKKILDYSRDIATNPNYIEKNK